MTDMKLQSASYYFITAVVKSGAFASDCNDSAFVRKMCAFVTQFVVKAHILRTNAESHASSMSRTLRLAISLAKPAFPFNLIA